MPDKRQHASKRRFRSILILLILLASLWVSVWGIASSLAPSLIRSAIEQLVTQVEQHGIELSEVSSAAIRISPLLNYVVLRNFHARFDLNPRDDIQLQSQVSLQDVVVRLGNVFTLRGSVQVREGKVRFDAADLPQSLPFDRFANLRLKVGNLPLTQPRLAAQDIRTKLKTLFFDNKAVGDVQFSGDVKLTVDEVELVAHLYTERDSNGFWLRFQESDIQSISDQKRMGLVSEQIEIVSRYPLRVPVIMMVTEQALDLARQHEPHDIWLHDAHRHVTWSFLLTQHFGPEFATMVTDAQEMKPGNTPNERAMDFHNNAIGRGLYKEGITLEALVQRVREDPDIIRHPDQVDSFGKERLLH